MDDQVVWSNGDSITSTAVFGHWNLRTQAIGLGYHATAWNKNTGVEILHRACPNRESAKTTAITLAIRHDEEQAVRAEIQELRARLERLNQSTYCAYCGHEYPRGTPKSENELLTAHIAVCEKHPMRQAEGEIERLKTNMALVALQRDNAEQNQSVVSRENAELRGLAADTQKRIADLEAVADGRIKTAVQGANELVVERDALRDELAAAQQRIAGLEDHASDMDKIHFEQRELIKALRAELTAENAAVKHNEKVANEFKRQLKEAVEERDTARAKLAAEVAKNADAINEECVKAGIALWITNHKYVCAACGESFSERDTLLLHIMECPHHPYSRREQALTDSEAARDALQARLDALQPFIDAANAMVMDGVSDRRWNRLAARKNDFDDWEKEHTQPATAVPTPCRHVNACHPAVCGKCAAPACDEYQPGGATDEARAALLEAGNAFTRDNVTTGESET